MGQNSGANFTQHFGGPEQKSDRFLDRFLGRILGRSSGAEISWVPSLALLRDPVPVPAVGLGAACREMVPYMGFPCAFLSTALSEPPRDPDSFATHSLRAPQAVTEAGPHKVRPNFFARLPYEFLVMLLRKGARYPQGPNRFLFGAPIDS